MIYRGYARVSTKEQSDNSLEIQERSLEKKAKIANCDFILYKEKKSGKNISERTELNKLLNDLKPGDIVGIVDNSRLGRNTISNLTIAERIKDEGCVLQIGGNVIDINKPDSKMLLTIESAVSSWQREIQNEKSRLGIDIKKEKGDWIFTSRLFGYNVEIIGKTVNVSIIEDEAKIIRYIFNEYASGKSMNKITKEVNALGYRSREGKPFPTATLRRYLHKPIFMGKYSLKSSPGGNKAYSMKGIIKNDLVKSNYYEPIIDEDLWWKVYESYRFIKRSHTRQFKYRWSAYKLSSVLKCRFCNNTYVHSYHKSELEKVNSNYVCRIHKKGCPQKRHTFREFVFNELFDIVYLLYYYNISDIIDFEAKLSKEFEVLSTEKKEEIVSIENQIVSLTNKLNDLSDFVTDNISEINNITKQSYLRNQNKIAKDIQKYELNKKSIYISLRRHEERFWEEYYDRRTEDVVDEIKHYIDDSPQGQRAELLNILKATIGHEEIIIKYNHGNSLKIKLENNRGRLVQKEFHITYTRHEKVSLQMLVNLDKKLVTILPPYYQNKDKGINQRYVKSYYAMNEGIIKDLFSKTDSDYQNYIVTH